MYVRVVEISGDYGVQERQVTRVNRIITIFFVVFIVCFYFIIIVVVAVFLSMCCYCRSTMHISACISVSLWSKYHIYTQTFSQSHTWMADAKVAVPRCVWLFNEFSTFSVSLQT